MGERANRLLGIPFIFSANYLGIISASDKAKIASFSLSPILQKESTEAR
jgi:hypothetical protein